MPRQAAIRINENEWAVSLATTYAELTTGLSGVVSMPAGTGMLFVLPADQPVSVTTEPMLFNIDIVFISSDLKVVDVAKNIAPGNIVTESTPVRYFLEVNAGEASSIESGDVVGITIYQPATNTLANWISPLVSIAEFMAVGAFMVNTVRNITKAILGEPKEREGLKLLPQTEGKPTRDDVAVDSWVERDRIGIWIIDKRTSKTIMEWWDEEAAQMFEDGWFKPGMISQQKITGRDFEESVLNYAEYIGVLKESGGLKVPYLPQAIERGDVIEIPFKEAPEWVQSAWKGLHSGSVPRVRVYRTTVARIHSPAFEYAVRDIVAHKAGRTVSRYVPSYESLLSSSPEEKALYFGGAVTLHPDEMLAVMDYWGDRFKSIDLYVHPVAYEPPKLVVPTLTDRQMKILATIRAYTSKYRKEVFETHGVTQAELDELQKLGLIDRRGAITVIGRNVVGRESPLTTYLPQTARTERLPAVAPKEGEYSWLIIDPETGEIMIKEGFSTLAKARDSAKAFAVCRAKYAGKHPVKLKIYDRSPDLNNLELGVVFEGRILVSENRVEETSAPQPQAEAGTKEVAPAAELLPKTDKPRGKVFFIGSCKVSEGLCLTHGYSVSDKTRCPQSPLTDEEWKAAWELVRIAYPEGQPNPWVNGWWPETIEEAEKAIKRYEEAMWDAFRKYEAIQQRAVENYARSRDKAIYYYRHYVMKEYERGKVESLVPQTITNPTKLDGLEIVKAYKQISAHGEDKIAVSLEAWAIFPRGRRPHFISMYRSGDEYVIQPLYAHIREWVYVPVAKVKAWIKSLPVRHFEPMAVALELREEAERLAREVDEPLDIIPLPSKESPPKVIPVGKRPRREGDLEYLADSPEFLTQTIEDIGYRNKIHNAFREAIARVKGLK